jgi:phenylacetate-CoA ligase
MTVCIRAKLFGLRFTVNLSLWMGAGTSRNEQRKYRTAQEADWMLAQLSRHIMYPLWDLKDRSIKLKEWRKLESSQRLSADELRARQWHKLKVILSYAYEHSPFYRQRMRQVGLTPADIRTPEGFRLLPITTKQDIREAGDAFISDEYRKDDLVMAKTGGSTGVSLNLFFDKQCEERRNAAAMRSDRWAGWELGMYRGALWGNPPKDFSAKRWIRNVLLDRTFVLDTMEMTPASMDAFIAQANARRRVAIFGHAHSIFILAKYIAESRRYMVRPRGIIATSMMLLENERAVIEQVLQCAVTNRYGCEEVGLIASECEEHSGLHLNIDHLYVEVLRDDGAPAVAGESGKIILTDFSNRGMPLLRYRVEDVGTLANQPCGCGREQPLLASIAGRVADFLKKKDGAMVAGVSLVERTLTAIQGIEQMQLVQNRLDEIVINRVKASDHSAQTDTLLLAEIQRVFGGDTHVLINDVTEIPQQRNGKYRFSICNI